MNLKPEYVIEWTMNGRDWFFCHEVNKRKEALIAVKQARLRSFVMNQGRKYRAVKITKEVIA